MDDPTLAPTDPSPSDEEGSATLVEAAPAVVAVVIVEEGHPVLDDVLAAVAAQDYPNLPVLVLDGSGDVSVPERVGRRVPEAVVRRVEPGLGFGAVADQVLRLVDGAAFYCFVDDDVVLEPSAIRLLVEESFRSNAGVIGPKVVEAEDRRRLLSVGCGADKAGFLAPYVEPGELDQEQHDAVRDVFVVERGCQLIRADLFGALGGFGGDMAGVGEDLDLCWRSHAAGARVIVNPAAVAACPPRPVDPDQERLRTCHRLRTVLTCYGPIHLLRVVPQLVVVDLLAALFAVVRGRFARAGAILGAWAWNLGHLGQILRRRRALNRIRQVPDNEVRDLQTKGFARLTSALRGHPGQADDEDRITTAAAVGRSWLVSLRHGPRRYAALTAVGLLLFWMLGSRDLLSRGIPSIGELGPVPGPRRLLESYLDGWDPSGLGSSSSPPTAYVLYALGGLVTLGNTGLLATLVVLVPLLLGWWGLWRATRSFASSRARVLAVVVYAAVPLPYNALARGVWTALAVYAATPWLVARLARAGGYVPIVAEGHRPARRELARHTMVAGLVVAIAGALAPIAFGLPVALAVVLAIGSLLAGSLSGARRVLTAGVGATLVGLVLNLPWSAELLTGPWSSIVGVRAGNPSDLGLGALVRFETGELGSGPLGYALLAVAALALVIGRGWRLVWATRAWVLIVAAVGAAWSVDRGWLDIATPPLEVLLAPAACGLALAAGTGLAAFEVDLRGYRFGWRQVLSAAAFAAFVLALGTPVVAVADGRWTAPRSGFDRSLAFLTDEAVEGGFRVLWLGEPRTLPLRGWWLHDGLAFGLSEDGAPDVRNRFPGDIDSAQGVADALNLAGQDQTSRLGRLLAPYAVRYVVVAERAAPARQGTPIHPAPEGLLSALASQLDLESVAVDEALTVFENTAWLPARAQLDPIDAAAAAGGGALVPGEPAGAEPVLTERRGANRWAGSVQPGTVFHSAAEPDRWTLSVSGEGDAEPQSAYGVATAFEVDQGGPARLSYRRPLWRVLLVLAQVLVWIVAVWLVQRWRRAQRPRRPVPSPLGALDPVLRLGSSPSTPTADELRWSRPAAEPDARVEEEVER